MVCRDRNRIAMQSDILGAYALGVRNLLCLSGDHQKFGNHPTAKNVYDLDSLQLIQMVRDMRDKKVFQCGDEIKNSKTAPVVEPRLFIGAAANPFADPFEFRVTRLAKKIAAGADFIQTQTIFDVPRFTRWMQLVRDRGLDQHVKILAGVMPVKSHMALQYMKNEVAGMSIPDELISRLKSIEDKDRRRAEGVAMCVETIRQVRQIPGVAGVHIMAVEWEEIVKEVVEKAGLR
jgi:methylenetetrahydrofolate reductase (NADPH)